MLYTISQIGTLRLYHFDIIISRGGGKNHKFRLKALREKRGVSQLKLALDPGMNQTGIKRYKTGAHEADYATLVKFADYFNVSLDYLRGRTSNLNMIKTRSTSVSPMSSVFFCIIVRPLRSYASPR